MSDVPCPVLDIRIPGTSLQPRASITNYEYEHEYEHEYEQVNGGTGAFS
ncbi:MAG: hypothetical protein GX414_04470 [Acidobacteria bacterium]|nr:hypothetical protein [Acidobacteriota bacterium]